MSTHTEDHTPAQAPQQYGTEHTLSVMQTLYCFYQRNIAYANRTNNEPLQWVAMDGAKRAADCIRRIKGQ